jgi:hypothetical protein
MEENKRNRDQASDRSTQIDQNTGQDNQTQNISDKRRQDENPQRGSQWSNYQTRELSDERSGQQNRGGERNQ